MTLLTLLHRKKRFTRPQMVGQSEGLDRNGSATTIDWEGLINSMSAHVARQEGLRPVINLSPASEDMTNGAYADFNGASSTAKQTTFDGSANGQVRQTITIVDDGSGAGNRTFIFSVKIKLISGTISSDSALQFSVTGDAMSAIEADIGNEVDGTTQRFTVSASTDAAGTDIIVGVVWDDAGVLEITEWQLEESTGRADLTTPSKYASTDVAEGPESIVYTSDFSSNADDWVQNIGDSDLTLDGNETAPDSTTECLKVTAVGGVKQLQIRNTSVSEPPLSYDTLTMDVFPETGAFSGGTPYPGQGYAASTQFKAIARESVTENQFTTVTSVAINMESGISYRMGFFTTAGGFTLDNLESGKSVWIKNVRIVRRKATTGHLSLDTTNGNSVTDNVVTEADGIPLHPMTTLHLPGHRSIYRYTRPDIIKNTQAYSVGDLVHTSAQIFKGCGNGFYYRVTTGGTTDGNAVSESDTWDETIGNTVSNNGVEFINAGHLKYTGMLFEPSAENICLRSKNFEHAAWVATNVTKSDNDVVAPDGKMTAATLTASAGNGTVIQDLGVIGSTATTGALWIKRKTGTGDIDLTIDGGVGWTTVAVTSTWTRFSHGQTLADPDFGIRIVIDTDSVYVWGGWTVSSNVLSSDIETIANPVTRPTEADSLQYTIEQIRHNDSQGSGGIDLVMDLSKTDLNTSGSQRLYTLKAANSRGLRFDASESLNFSEGSNVVTRSNWVSKHIVYRLTWRWNVALDEMELVLITSSGTTSYDGSFNSDGLIHFFENITQLRCWMSNFWYTRSDVGSAAIIAAAQYDQAA